MFETKRCVLKLMDQKDLEDVKRLFRDEQVRKYLGGVRDESVIEKSCIEMLEKRENHYYWVIKNKMSQDFIGLVSLDPHHDGETLEVSYQLLPHWWGQGLATEAVQAIIYYGLDELNLNSVVAETRLANSISCKLLEKLGMKEIKRIHRFGNEQIIYAISKQLAE